MQLIIVVEQEGRPQCYKESPGCAACGNQEIKTSKEFRRWPETIQFTMADHAANEQTGRVNGDLQGKRYAGSVTQTPTNSTQGKSQGQRKRPTRIPARIVE